MSQENVELVRRRFGAPLHDDWETALEDLAPDVEVRDFDIPDAGVYRGHDGFMEWLLGWDAGWESWRVEDVERGKIVRIEYFNDQKLALEAVGLSE
jgi:hypothetical protein